LLPDATNYFSPLILTVAIISLICASLSTIIQQDNKRLIAYSSVAHMAVVVLGLFSNNLQGIEGAILLAIGHGFTSPALFICVGGIIYDRTGTRNINYIRGLATYMPLFTIFFFIFTLCNTGIPLSINWIGEILSLMGIWQQNPIIACLGASGICLSACYSVFLYNRISYGNLSPYLPPLKDLNRREYYMLISLLIPTLVFGILPNVLLTPLHVSVTSLLYVIPPITILQLDLGSPALAVLQQETVINSSIVAFFACFTKLNLDKILTDVLGLRFESKEECYKLISFFFLGILLGILLVILSAVLFFFFNIYDLILFIFLSIISNFVIIQAKIREILKFLLPKRDLRLYVTGAVAGASTNIEESDSSSDENSDTTAATTVSGSDSENEDLRICDYDYANNRIRLRRTDTWIDIYPKDETASSSSTELNNKDETASSSSTELNNKGETASSSSTELLDSKDAKIKPLETIEEENEEIYEEEDEGYNASYESDESDEWSKFNSPCRSPAPDSSTRATPGDSSSDIEIEDTCYNSDNEAPDSSTRATPGDSSSDIEIEDTCYNSNDEAPAPDYSTRPSFWDSSRDDADYDDWDDIYAIFLPLTKYAFNSKILTMLARVNFLARCLWCLWIVYSFFDPNLTSIEVLISFFPSDNLNLLENF